MQAERYSDDAVREVAESTAREFGYAHMKSEQLRVVKAFVQGNDVFANWLSMATFKGYLPNDYF